MKLIRCQKCGSVVISEEAFLQNIVDAMEETCRKARKAKCSERSALLQEASEYKAIYKAFMHHLTERDRAKDNVSGFMVSELHKFVSGGGTITADNFQSLCDKGKERAALAREQKDRELKRIYGDFETISNRTMPDPVAQQALKRCEHGGKRYADD